jgi:hypothetical protein
MPAKFYVQKTPKIVHSHKTWWPGYNLLWGYRFNGELEYLFVPKSDYENLLIFASSHQFNTTFSMDIVKVKSFWGNYWTLSNFA